MKKFKVPNVLVLLFVIIIIATVCTYIVPAGEYERVEKDGREVVDPDSYHRVERNPVSPFGMLKAIHTGMVDVASIAFFILIVGGTFGIIQETGAIFAGISSTARRLQGKERAIIPVIMIIFALGGSVFGMSEELIAFIPLMVPLCLALGFDSITGAAIVLVGAGAGFAGAFMNPFTIGVAQGIADLPLFSGMKFRVFVWVVLLGISIFYVYRYAGKVKANPELSLTYEEDKQKGKIADFSEFSQMTLSHRLVLLVTAVLFIVLIIGVVKFGWYINELAAIFLAMGILSAIVAKLGVNKTADAFIAGSKDLAFVALIVGISRGVLVILTEGYIIDTVLHGMSTAIAGLPSFLSAVVMFIFQCLLNIIVPSGSGQAALTMPIMAPLSDIAGVTRQTAVLAYQFGDGFTNIWSPTSGYFMAALGIAGIEWKKWSKWFKPLLITWFITGAIFVIIAQSIQFGPF